MKSFGENFERPNEVNSVHVVVKSEENADWLRIGALFTNCTHLDSILDRGKELIAQSMLELVKTVVCAVNKGILRLNEEDTR